MLFLGILLLLCLAAILICHRIAFYNPLPHKEDPYDMEKLAVERQAARDRINEIQNELKKLD